MLQPYLKQLKAVFREVGFLDNQISIHKTQPECDYSLPQNEVIGISNYFFYPRNSKILIWKRTLT